MQLAAIPSGTLVGIEAVAVTVEVDLAFGLPNFQVVGLGDAAILESRERVRAAIRNAGFEFPPRRLTCNLAPAVLKKAGPQLDLAIALAVLAASGQIAPSEPGRWMVVGELSLEGALRAVPGALPLALAARRQGFAGLVLPMGNAPEAALVPELAVVGVGSLREAAETMAEGPARRLWRPAAAPPRAAGEPGPDFAEVRGQQATKRALEIAAAGAHNVLLAGSQGSGKTMLARRLPGILPPLSREEALEVSQVHSVVGLLPPEGRLAERRPFRAPHHSVSMAGLIGGGAGLPQPGEVTLAHRGVLFLDELTEFRRELLDALRQPLEDGCVTIARAYRSLTFPARLMLVAAMNPCLCGYYGDPAIACTCTESIRQRYWRRLSGPFLDRLDLRVAVPRLTPEELAEARPAESSATVRARVAAARERQLARQGCANALLRGAALKQHAGLDAEGAAYMRRAASRQAMSARGYDRALKLARTIADLAGAGRIEGAHVAEALQLDSLAAWPAARL